MSLVAFFPYPTRLLEPTCLSNLHKISTLVVYLGLSTFLIGEPETESNLSDRKGTGSLTMLWSLAINV